MAGTLLARSVARGVAHSVARSVTDKAGYGGDGAWTPSEGFPGSTLNLWNRGDTNALTGGARDVDGVNQTFSAADFAAVDLSTGDFGISIAFNRDDTGNQVLLGKYEDANNYYRLELNASDILHFIAVVGGVTKVEVTGTTAISDTTWHVATLSVDRDTAASTFIYLDIADDTTGTPTVSTDDIDNTGAFYVAESGATSLFFNGQLCRAGVAKGALLTSANVTELWSLGNGLVYGAHSAALQAKWTQFNNGGEASGNLIAAVGTNLTANNAPGAADGSATEIASDSSANLNHGVSNAGPIAWKSETPDGTPDPSCQDTSGNNYHLTIVDGTAASYSDTAGSEYPRDASVPAGIGSTASLECDGTLYGKVQTSPFFSQSATEAAIEFYCDIESADFNGTVVVACGSDSNPSANDGCFLAFDDRGGGNATDGLLIGFATVTGGQRAAAYDNVIAGLSAGFHIFKVSYDPVNFIRLWIDGALQTVTTTVTSGTGDFVPKNSALAIGAQFGGTNQLPATTRLDRVRLYSDAAATTLIAEYLFHETNLRVLPLLAAGGSWEGDGVDDYVNLGLKKIAPLLNGAAGVTAQVWVNIDTLDGTDQDIFVVPIAASSKSGIRLTILATTDLIRVGGRSVSGDSLQTASSVSVIVTGEFTHIAGVLNFTDDTVELYVNGVLVATTAATFANATFTDAGNQTGNSMIGSTTDTPALFFDGLIDDVQIHSSALTPTQIYSTYTGTNVASPAGHVKLDDGAQSPVADQDPIIEWMSKEGSNLQFQQATAAKRPLARLGDEGMNGKTAVQFNNVNQILILDSAPITDVVGTITVSFETDANPTGSGDMTLIGSAKASVANEYLEALSIDNAGKLYTEFNDAGTVHRVTGGTVLSANTKYVVTVTATAAGAWVITLDGVDETLAVTVANSGKWFGDLDAPTNMFIGGRAISTGEDNHFGGLFAEDVLYDTDLTDVQQDSVESYKGSRYGVTIA